MKVIGIVEAKAKLAEICERVAVRHESVTITNRGKPLVRIEPVENPTRSVWEARAKFLARGETLPSDSESRGDYTQERKKILAGVTLRKLKAELLSKK